MGYVKEVFILPEKKKLGRPTDNPKGTSTHIRLDAECVDTLAKYCSKYNIVRAEAIRRGIKRLKDEL